MAYQFNEWQEKWLQALESGEYKQIRGTLKDGDGYCCLGVAARVCGMTDEEIGRYRTLYEFDTVKRRMCLRSEGDFKDDEFVDGYCSLAVMNDGKDDRQKDFRQIAAFIRANPEKVFTDAV